MRSAGSIDAAGRSTWEQSVTKRCVVFELVGGGVFSWHIRATSQGTMQTNAEPEEDTMDGARRFIR